MKKKIDVSFKVTTSGTGSWSPVAKDVFIRSLVLEGDDEILVNVVFDPTSWDVHKDGLIYTDPGFLTTLIIALMNDVRTKGVAEWEKLNYTEQGMQTHDHVHMILGEW